MFKRGSGGRQGAMTPPVPVKTNHKKMAATFEALHFVYLATPPSDNPGSTTGVSLQHSGCTCFCDMVTREVVSRYRHNIWVFLTR